MIKVEIVKDSEAPNGSRLTTFVLTYPRFVHSELMTHRAFSRNASSSRAIPVKKQIKMVMNNPAMPLAFRANKAGMQAGELFGPFKQFLCRLIWKSACYAAVFFATLMDKLNIHKQYANRILEPWAHITVVLSATEYANFFALRLHPAAQPEICELARQMWEAYETNEPDEMVENEMHLPFVDSKEVGKVIRDFSIKDHHATLIKMSVARCARVSYLNHDGKKPTVEEDLKLYDRLLGQLPIHASPAEHQAMAMSMYSRNAPSGNFRGWIQYRKTLENENITRFDGPKDGTQS